MGNSSIGRLPEPWGALIDRERTISFSFEGKNYEGFEGDTLASALAANGELLLSRSFKYHRPRGAYTFAGHDANSYVQIGDEPNVLADMLAISDGLSAAGQNYIKSLRVDYAAVGGRLSSFLPVGFYYRAFFRPKGIWQWWERFFRRAAGLGRLGRVPDQRYFDKQYLFIDVAVIGGGPAGLSAALVAASEGATVLLIDEAQSLGGSLNYARFQRDRSDVASLREDLIEQVTLSDKIRILKGATCSGWFTDNWLAISTPQRLFKLRAKFVIACTGSVEQPMVFRNNDLPGVLPASGVQRLLRLYGVRPGSKVVVATANIEGYDVAMDLLDAGISVEAVVDINQSTSTSESVKQLSGRGIAVHQSYAISEAIPGKGMRSIIAVVINKLSASGETTGDGLKIDCDLLVTSVGYAPLGQLACHSGGQLVYDDDVHSFVVHNQPQRSALAGSVNHRYSLEAVLADGRSAGLDATHAIGLNPDAPTDTAPDPGAACINHPYPIFPHRKGKDFVDFDEDQTVADLQNAVTDGFDHPELAKRYSTVGMGPSQGRLSSLNALRIVRRHNGKNMAGTSVTTQRPPFRPLSFGVLAGRSFEPERRTPMHHWHADHGATFMPAGMWQRPAYYAGNAGSKAQIDEQVSEEVAAIRTNVGAIDVSTLGGIEIRGPDAAEFLNCLYTFTYEKQPVGRSRYLLMTDESGCIVDDGVACRLGDEHFYVTTTTTGSDAVYRSMLRHNAEWRLQIDVLNVTSTYAGINIAGPHSRQLLEKLKSDIDFSRDTFPYLAVRQGSIDGHSVTAIRVGFIGELGYELHVPWSQALALWETLFVAGENFGIRPVGVEAQRVLRLEKGHLIVGQDTDGLTMPRDAALDWAVKSDKPYFVGKSALAYSGTRPKSRCLVGFRLLNSCGPIPEECHLVIRDGEIAGRVTSVAHSRHLDEVIGLAYVTPEQAEVGSEFDIKVAANQLIRAQTVATPFYDPSNLRQDF